MRIGINFIAAGLLVTALTFGSTPDKCAFIASLSPSWHPYLNAIQKMAGLQLEFIKELQRNSKNEKGVARDFSNVRTLLSMRGIKFQILWGAPGNLTDLPILQFEPIADSPEFFNALAARLKRRYGVKVWFKIGADYQPDQGNFDPKNNAIHVPAWAVLKNGESAGLVHILKYLDVSNEGKSGSYYGLAHTEIHVNSHTVHGEIYDFTGLFSYVEELDYLTVYLQVEEQDALAQLKKRIDDALMYFNHRSYFLAMQRPNFTSAILEETWKLEGTISSANFTLVFPVNSDEITLAHSSREGLEGLFLKKKNYLSETVSSLRDRLSEMKKLVHSNQTAKLILQIKRLKVEIEKRLL